MAGGLRGAAVGTITILTAALLVAAVSTAAYAEPSTHNDSERAVVAYINAERVAKGLEPLTLHDDNQYAIEASLDYVETRNAHALMPQFRETGVYSDYRGFGEVQTGLGCSLESAVYAWTNSEEHRAIIMHPDATHIAFAALCTPNGGGGDTQRLSPQPRAGQTAHILVGNNRGDGEVLIADQRADLSRHQTDFVPVEAPSEEVVAERIRLAIAIGGTLTALLFLAGLRGWLRQRSRRRAFRQNLERRPTL